MSVDLDFYLLNLFALNLRKFRRNQKLSQSQLAFEVDISLRHLQRIEKGEFKTNVVVLFKLAEALRVNMDDFFKDI